MDFFAQLNNRISQILVISSFKNCSNEIRSNEIRIRQELPVLCTYKYAKTMSTSDL